MGDELIAGAPLLLGVAIAGELKGTRNRLAIDLDRAQAVLASAVAGILLGAEVELLDDGEDVSQQLFLL